MFLVPDSEQASHWRGPAMRFPFLALPAASGGALTPRPVVDIALEGITAAPIGCLLDTGALRTRMSAELLHPLPAWNLTTHRPKSFTWPA